MQHKKHTSHKYRIQVKQTKRKNAKTTIKAKVMHVYVSTSVLANDIQILGFISCRDGQRELAPYLEATASISLWVSEMKTDFQF